MCMNTSPNVHERPKLLRFMGIDIFSCNLHVIELYDCGVTQGDNSEIQNAVFSKGKTSRTLET